MSDISTHIRSPEKAAILKILTGPYKGKQFRLLSSKISIGQSSDSDIILKNNKSCSENHALITYDNKNQYMIRSLDPANFIIVNKKPVNSHQLKSKDIITVGKSEFLFLDKGPLPSHHSSEYKKHQKDATMLRQNKSKNSIRIAFTLIICFALGYFFLNKEVKKEQIKKGLKTQQEILDEINVIKSISDKEFVKKNLSHEQEEARIVFIKGFRDYRKGYYHRALKFFEHCTTIQKDHQLCLSYSKKSKIQSERLIQRKIVLGRTYQKNKQYAACEAAFKSIEIMVQDSSSPVYKEAKENRKLCQIKTINKI